VDEDFRYLRQGLKHLRFDSMGNLVAFAHRI
jgi:hypothetical protein